jgi:hypothetical protein
MSRSITRRVAGAVLAAGAITIAAGAAPALGVGGPAFTLKFAKDARLLPTLHATEVLDAEQESREYDYVTKGYFKIAGTTVARLPAISGHVDATRQHRTLIVKRSTRSTIRAAAKRRGARRVTLTLVHRLTLTTHIPGDQTPRTQTATQDTHLTIPR